jgi:hypothetical protein
MTVLPGRAVVRVVIRTVWINLCEEVPDQDDAFIASILKKKLAEFPPFAC